MPIEVLYVIPIIALSGFVFGWIFFWQKNKNKSVKPTENSVSLYDQPLFAMRENNQSGTIQKTIELVSAALSNQQKLIERLTGEDSPVAGQLHDLKTRLSELQKEYDIVSSENLTLRAHVRSQRQDHAVVPDVVTLQKSETEKNHVLRDTDKIDTNAVKKLSDTQKINLDDTHEISRSDIF